MTDTDPRLALEMQRDDASPWQPIETAPRGTLVLCYDHHAQELRFAWFVGWRHNGSAPGCVTTTERAQRPATHWVPIPNWHNWQAP